MFPAFRRSTAEAHQKNAKQFSVPKIVHSYLTTRIRMLLRKYLPQGMACAKVLHRSRSVKLVSAYVFLSAHILLCILSTSNRKAVVLSCLAKIYLKSVDFEDLKSVLAEITAK